MISKIQRRLFALVLPLALAWSAFTLAKDIPITPDTDLRPSIKQAEPGDVFVLQDGDWLDANLKFESLSGTHTAPIHIRAQTPGQVVFSGSTQFRISGQHIIVSGLVFRDTADVSDVVQFRTHSERHAHHCRITDCVFEQTPAADVGIESRWLSIYGTHNRVDHCYFAGKRSRGTALVVWVSEAIEENRIDHNHFGYRPKLGKNGGEIIRIGTSDVSELDCKSIVEMNYFHKCNGEAEIISNKACGNIYRHNVFDQCEGALTLRHGHRCKVDANLFLGRKQTGTGGVRVIGQDHIVTNNYFEGLRGDDERAALCIMSGIPDGPLNTYAPIRNALIAHNTVIDCKVAMEMGYGFGKKQTAVPTHCRFANNLFLPGKWWLIRTAASPIHSVWPGNKLQHGRLRKQPLIDFDRVDAQLERGSDGLLRPTDVKQLSTAAEPMVQTDIDGQPRSETTLAGCSQLNTNHRKWPSPKNTGPTWKRDTR